MDGGGEDNHQSELKRRLAALNPIFAAAAVGDFSKDVEITEVEDELTEFFVGVQVMIEVIREKTAELEQINANLNKQIEARTRDLEQQKQDLAGKISELERLNKTMIGRELKMIELKQELKALKTKQAKDQDAG